jgi:hypothetical protein
MPMKKYKIAVLDDYQNAAVESADWSVLRDRADISVFQDHLADSDALIERLQPFDVVCVMRERSPLSRNVIERLPNLKLIASTGTGSWDPSSSHGVSVGPNYRVYLGADSGLSAKYRHGEQLRTVRWLAANSGH